MEETMEEKQQKKKFNKLPVLKNSNEEYMQIIKMCVLG
jgi:hypothetical protein